MTKSHLWCGAAAAIAALSFGAAAFAEPGSTLYETHCSGCHQPAGEGMAGAFPPLAGAPLVTGDPKPVIGVVLHGRGTAMPPFADALNDEELAAIISHTRTSWGNKATPVTAADVAAVRKAPH